MTLTEKQVEALKCAHADLVGVYQTIIRDNNAGFDCGHDWKAHKLSIGELEDAFPEHLIHIPIEDES